MLPITPLPALGAAAARGGAVPSPVPAGLAGIRVSTWLPGRRGS